MFDLKKMSDDPISNSYAVVVEAKKELTIHMVNLLSPFIYDEFAEIYKRILADETVENKLEFFIQKLKNVPEWNQILIEKLYDKFLSKSGNEVFGDLLKGIFVSNVKVLSAVRLKNTRQQIEINVPNNKKFLHKCFIESAKKIFKNPFILSEDVDVVEKYRNQREFLEMIGEAIEEAIRRMLPVGELLKEYLNPPPDPEPNEEDIDKMLEDLDNTDDNDDNDEEDKEDDEEDEEDKEDKDEEKDDEKKEDEEEKKKEKEGGGAENEKKEDTKSDEIELPPSPNSKTVKTHKPKDDNIEVSPKDEDGDEVEISFDHSFEVLEDDEDKDENEEDDTEDEDDTKKVTSSSHKNQHKERGVKNLFFDDLDDESMF